MKPVARIGFAEVAAAGEVVLGADRPLEEFGGEGELGGSVGGIGEPAVAPTSGAIANARSDLTGMRVFDLPLTTDRVLAAMVQNQSGELL